EPYERLRNASDRVLAATGTRPRVLLVTLGTPAEFTPRASFAGNFFAAGGIETVAVELADAPVTVRDAAVCLCSTDEIYAKEAATAVKALAEAGARHIYLAGRP